MDWKRKRRFKRLFGSKKCQKTASEDVCSIQHIPWAAPTLCQPPLCQAEPTAAERLAARSSSLSVVLRLQLELVRLAECAHFAADTHEDLPYLRLQPISAQAFVNLHSDTLQAAMGEKVNGSRAHGC
ncbi:hypothetical protein WJX73_010034 [Symbiochloris irregularis]|uniref:Uncharacterized protein n=1 Tax=Symbiochloris irregularis TaxID=706552 RepID=A0AAW1PWN9_9CHLO